MNGRTTTAVKHAQGLAAVATRWKPAPGPGEPACCSPQAPRERATDRSARLIASTLAATLVGGVLLRQTGRRITAQRAGATSPRGAHGLRRAEEESSAVHRR